MVSEPEWFIRNLPADVLKTILEHLIQPFDTSENLICFCMTTKAIRSRTSKDIDAYKAKAKLELKSISDDMAWVVRGRHLPVHFHRRGLEPEEVLFQRETCEKFYRLSRCLMGMATHKVDIAKMLSHADREYYDDECKYRQKSGLPLRISSHFKW